MTRTRSKEFLASFTNASNPSPWNTLHMKLPPGLSTFRAISSASSTRYMERGWSTAFVPLILGAISLITRSAPPSPTFSSNSSYTASSRKSPSTNSTPGRASMGSRSTATMRTLPSSFSVTYWLQLPGAAPRSTQTMPGRSKRSFVSICSSLNTARDRHPSLRARCTKGSRSWRSRQLPLDRRGLLIRALSSCYTSRP